MTQLFLGEVRQKIFTEPSIKLWCVLIIFHEVLNIRSIAFDVSNVIPQIYVTFYLCFCFFLFQFLVNFNRDRTSMFYGVFDHFHAVKMLKSFFYLLYLKSAIPGAIF